MVWIGRKKLNKLKTRPASVGFLKEQPVMDYAMNLDNVSLPFEHWVKIASSRLFKKPFEKDKSYEKRIIKLALKLQKEADSGWFITRSPETYNVGKNALKRKNRALKKAGNND